MTARFWMFFAAAALLATGGCKTRERVISTEKRYISSGASEGAGFHAASGTFAVPHVKREKSAWD